MPTGTTDPDDRLPTRGPESPDIERYELVATGSEQVILFDTEAEGAWIQSSECVELEAWR